MALSTSQLRGVWGPPCKIISTRVPIFGGAVISVDHRVAAAFLALSRVFERWNYPCPLTNPPTTGAYNCRPITGGTGYSLHAFGIAADFRWDHNPYGPHLTTDMPHGMTVEAESLRTNSGAQLFRWGGNYTGNKDAMHYEIVCTPADVASGIREPAAPTQPPASLAETTGDDMAIHWQHPDGRWERTWVNPTNHQLETRWQTTAGGLFGPYLTINTPGLTWEPDSLAASKGLDGNLNWSVRKLGGGQANEYVGWYQEPVTGHPEIVPGWKGPFDMDG